MSIRLTARDAALVLLTALGYYAGTKIGFALTPREIPISVFWPPNAILLSALLLAPIRLWWVYLIALIPVHFLAQGASGVPIATSFGWLIGNAGEAVLGAALMTNFGRRTVWFHTARGTTSFLLFGFILAPVATSFLDAAIVVGTQWGHDYWVLWITRLLSNMVAQLTIVPTIVVFGRRRLTWITDGPNRRWVEAGMLATLLLLSSLFVFQSQTLSRTNIPALIYLPLPLLLWAAMRFGPSGLSLSLLTISFVSIQNVMHGRGPFISTSVDESVLSMQVFLCMIGVPLLLLAAVTMERQRAERSLSETSRKLIDAQEREREHLARELHDDVGQRLTLASIELDRILARDPSHSSNASFVELRGQVAFVSRTIWEISHGLYPANLEYVGLPSALTRLCADVRDGTDIELECETAGIPEHLPAGVSLCFYRVAQEALQNVMRHSRAKNVSVRLWSRRDLLVLRITDDGVGFNPALPGSGLGLASIHERLKALEGGVQIESEPGEGTRFEAWVDVTRHFPKSDLAPTIS